MSARQEPNELGSKTWPGAWIWTQTWKRTCTHIHRKLWISIQKQQVLTAISALQIK